MISVRSFKLILSVSKFYSNFISRIGQTRDSYKHNAINTQCKTIPDSFLSEKENFVFKETEI